MTTIILFALFLILMMLLMAGLQWLIRKLDYSQEERFLQIRFIAALLLLELGAFNYYTASLILKLLDGIINHPSVMQVMSNVLPNRAHELVYILLVTLGLNLILLLGALVLFLVVKLVFGHKQQYFLEDEDYIGAKRIHWLSHKLVCSFYDPSGNPPVLRDRSYVMCQWAGAMKWVFGILAVLQVLILAVSILWGPEDWNAIVQIAAKAWYWLPMGGFLLAGQIEAFLEADPDLSAGSVGSSQVTCQIRGNMGDMVKVYMRHLSKTGALLCIRQLKVPKKEDAGVTNSPGNLMVDECENGELLLVLCRQLKDCGVNYQSVRYQKALATLLDGKHVNVCDKVEGEFFIYLIAYLNFILSQGQTAVLLCKSSEDALHMKKVCQEQMYRLNDIGSIWSICTAEEAAKDLPMNLLVCSYEELHTKRLLQQRREFASVLKTVIVAQGEQMFSQDHIRIMGVFNELRMYSRKLQYILLSETDNDGLRTAMENFMCDGELIPFNNATCKDRTYVMIWAEESCYRLQNQLGIGGDMAPYMGTAVPLALLAAGCDVPITNLVPADDRPETAYWENMCSNKLDVERFLSNDADIHAVIRRAPEEALLPESRKLVILYDTQYDFLSTLWGWTKYAGSDSTVFQIISPHYLLREYYASLFAADAISVQDRPVEALVPHSRAMEISNMISLLVDLCDKGMTEGAVLQRSREYGWPYRDVEAVLDACLSVVLQSAEKYNIFEHFRFEQKTRQVDGSGVFATETFVTLADPETISRIRSQIQRAVVQVSADQQIQLPILQGNITNHYLRDQIFALDGYSYRVDAITDGVIYATQQNDRYAYEYFPVCRFEFRDYQIMDHCVDSAYVDMNIATALVVRDVYAYWKSNCGYRIEGGDVFSLENLSYGIVHDEKTANILEINLPEEIMGEAPRNVALTLAFILNGMFKTLFPDTHRNLFVVVPGLAQEEDPLLNEILINGESCSKEQIIRSLIPVTVGEDSRKPGVQTIYIVEFSCVEYGMVQQIYRNHDRILRMVQDYLSWYLSPAPVPADSSEPDSKDDTPPEDTPPDDTEEMDMTEPKMSGRELHFGGAEIPGVFAPEALLALLPILTGEEVRTPEEVRNPLDLDIELTNTCTFCGKSAPFMREFSDGRWMCNLCYDHQVTQREEVRELLAHTMIMMEKGYGITLRKNLNVRFKNAAEILRETGGVAGGRILGFYRHAGHQLWLESRGPRAPMMSTLVHELTHSWQMDKLPLARLKRALPIAKREELMLMLIEGHACYVEVETMHLVHEEAFACRQERILMARNDVYGRGYRFLKDYFESKKAEGSHMNAFTIMELLVDDIIKGRVTLNVN